jgi:hypothetical protein
MRLIECASSAYENFDELSSNTGTRSDSKEIEQDLLSAISMYHPEHDSVVSKAKDCLGTLCKTKGGAP